MSFPACSRARRFLTVVAALVVTSTATACGVITPDPPSTPSPTPTSASPTPSPTPEPPELEDHAPGLGPEAEDFEVDATGKGKPVTVSVGKNTKATWRSTNVGLSFEASDLADPRWEPGESSLDLLIGSLDEPSLRFGGNSVDRRVWWTSSGEKAPSWAKATVTPKDLERVGRFLDEVDATVTLVLPLGHVDPDRAADMAAHARKAWGERLIAVAFGNEPNGYHHPNQPELQLRDAGYGPSDWVGEARRVQKAVEKETPGLGVMGPGAYDAQWWRAFGDADLPGTVAMTQHWYPLWSCPDRKSGGDRRFAPTVENMTSTAVHQKASATFTKAKKVASSYDLPLFVDETGPTSCPGTNETSRTLAQGLWAVDYTFNGARHGVQRMNMHSALQPCKGGPPMSVVCDRERKEPSEDLKGRSNYLALLFAGQVPEGTMKQVKVTGSSKVFAYAVDHEDGTDLVVVNMDKPGRPRPLDLNGLGDGTIQGSLLTGEDLGSRSVDMTPLSPATEMPDVIDGGSALLIRVTAGR
ncbi:hypothetical protein [Propioniferax innocua]|uniref:Glycosyl hydrolase family 79 n=1 Tax=Propioniferax innocua TaxID=1753 RepID=A0A542ZDK3_9ACTN|nr:hypothetical protein [Propioniferax innocua]TQL58340.1 hypothetical protein FB460_2201 [Propioniferax innocua]